MTMRVAHFVQRYPPALGGSEAWFARLSRYLVQQGHDISVFTTSAIDLEAFWRPGRCVPAGATREDGVEVRRYPPWYWPGRRYLLKALSLIPWRLGQCLTLPVNPICPAMWRDAGQAEPRFDVVHAAAFPYAFPIACGLRLARRQGIPFIVTPFVHLGDLDDPKDPIRQRYLTPPLLHLLRSADQIIVQTELERSALSRAGLAGDRLIRVGLGVDPAECTGGQRQRARQQWGIDDSAIVVGHLANLSWEKGSIDLLNAAALAWQRRANFEVVMAGPAMKQFRQQPTPERIRCPGVLTDEQRLDFFAGIDLFVLPSRSDSFGLVLLEAWANGVPNLAYRAGGPAEVIRHEQDGLLVKCGDVDGLAAAIQRLVQDAGLRRKLGQAGQDRLETEFAWRDKLEGVAALLRGAARA